MRCFSWYCLPRPNHPPPQQNLVTANPSLLAVQLKWLSASAVWALVYNMERAKQQLRPLIQPFLVDAAELTAKHLQVEQRTLGGLRLAGETEAEGSELLSMLSECLQQIETVGDAVRVKPSSPLHPIHYYVRSLFPCTEAHTLQLNTLHRTPF